MNLFCIIDSYEFTSNWNIKKIFEVYVKYYFILPTINSLLKNYIQNKYIYHLKVTRWCELVLREVNHDK